MRILIKDFFSWLCRSNIKTLIDHNRVAALSIRMEGRVADGVYIGATPPEVLEEAIDNIQIGKEKRLDGNENILINSFWAWHIKSDKEEAYKESRRELAWRARKLEKSLLQHYFSDDECEEIAAKFESFVDAYFDRSGNIKDIDIEIANKLCRVFTSTGDLADLGSEIARFKQFEKMGQTHLSLRLHDDPKAALEERYSAGQYQQTSLQRMWGKNRDFILITGPIVPELFIFQIWKPR